MFWGRGLEADVMLFDRMTFLGGGRACIGFKFAEMEISEWLILNQIFL